MPPNRRLLGRHQFPIRRNAPRPLETEALTPFAVDDWS
jgi:hypothetical protein